MRLQASSKSPHHHDVPDIGRSDGQAERIYRVGESFQLPHSAIHNEGAAGSAPVKVMAVFVVEKGKPMVQLAAD